MPEFGYRSGIKKAVNLWGHRLESNVCFLQVILNRLFFRNISKLLILL